MAENIIYDRLVCKHNTEAVWKEQISFIPFKGELIIYDTDENYDYERFKIGDGCTPVNFLPFIDRYVVDLLNNHIYNKSNPHNVTLGNLGISASKEEINHLIDVHENIQVQLNKKLEKVELDDLGISASNTEINQLNGITENIQVQLNKKLEKVELDDLGISASQEEINTLSGVTENVQAQLNSKANNNHGNHIPSPETADIKTFLRNDNTWQQVTPGNIGAAEKSHPHTASDIGSGTFTGKVQANSESTALLGTPQVRNICASTNDLTPGSSSLTTGTLYFVYE